MILLSIKYLSIVVGFRLGILLWSRNLRKARITHQRILACGPWIPGHVWFSLQVSLLQSIHQGSWKARCCYRHSSRVLRVSTRSNDRVVSTTPVGRRMQWSQEAVNNPSHWWHHNRSTTIQITPEKSKTITCAIAAFVVFSISVIVIMYGRGKSSVLPAWMTSGSDSAVSVVVLCMSWFLECYGPLFISWWQAHVVRHAGLGQQFYERQFQFFSKLVFFVVNTSSL